jgi:hypothetical protein
MKPLYKTTIIVWTDYDPITQIENGEVHEIMEEFVEIADKHNAMINFPIKNDIVLIDNPDNDEDFLDTGYFND